MIFICNNSSRHVNCFQFDQNMIYDCKDKNSCQINLLWLIDGNHSFQSIIHRQLALRQLKITQPKSIPLQRSNLYQQTNGV